ncbi:MAG TPA: dienelactone hydrolase family protein [Rhodospirillaceae bacterium]|nr:dienelactone hydrolase family protein [Rhodospirillaceae bacterium]
MGEFIELTASDGHKLAAWRASPKNTPRAAVLVIQEIFGVNSHIRDVAERFAAQGYLAVAPAMFDRYERGFETAYGADDMARARALMGRLDWAQALLDIEAARQCASVAGKVGAVGYCWGGSVAWLAAGRLPIQAAVGYYGGQIERFKDEAPRCPTILHFGKEDGHIPLSSVEAIGAAQPQVPIYLYDAGHGFSCDQRASFNAAAHGLAWQRTLAFLAESLDRPI